MSLTVLVSLFCDLQCFRFLPVDMGTATNTVVSCQAISREATMRPDSRKYLKLYKTSTVNVSFWCQRLRIKERHFFLSRFTIFTGVTRREIHHSRGRDNSLSLTAASIDHDATPTPAMLHVRRRLQLFCAAGKTLPLAAPLALVTYSVVI